MSTILRDLELLPDPASPFTRLANGEQLEAIVRPGEGIISRRIFADPEVFAMEQERIFGRAWFFLGHESEIPNPGDVVTRQCGMDPVLLLRDEAGAVRAFLNTVPARKATKIGRLSHNTVRLTR